MTELKTQIAAMQKAAKLLPELSDAGLRWLQDEIADEQKRRDKTTDGPQTDSPF